MRRFMIVVVLCAFGYFGYRYYDRNKDHGAADAGNADIATTSDGELPGDIVDRVEPTPAPPAAGEEDELRDYVREHPGAESDRHRVRLGEILIASPDSQREAEAVLVPVMDRKGEASVEAAALLCRGASDPQVQIRSASYILEQGPGAPGRLRALAIRGRELAARPEDAARVEAWKHLSEAYFGTEDATWRAAVRPDLDAIVKDLILSSRLTAACVNYTIQSGDTLAKIAREHKTTVDCIRWLNGLKDDRIHPGGHLKIITGAVTIEIVKSDFRLDALLDGKYLFSAPVGIGKLNKTPVGEFVIDLMQENPDWQKPGRPAIPYGHPDNPLGERWLGFKDTEQHSGYGIHGTKDPETVGTESSEGCIRLRNEDVVTLYRFVPKGTKVTIRD